MANRNSKRYSEGLRMSHGLSQIEPRKQRSSLKSICLVATCTIAMIVNNGNAAGTTIALPSISKELNIPENQLQWVIALYPLTSSCFLLIFGRLADLYGRKHVLMAGLLSLLGFTLGCSFAQTAVTLNILRAFQGIAAASLVPASLGILAHSFPPGPSRSVAFATFSAGAPLGGAIGIILGGVLTQYSKQTWRSTFYLSAGLIALALIGCVVSVDKDHHSDEVNRRTDWIGCFLITTGLVLVIFVLGQGESAPKKWTTPYIIALLIVGVIFVVLFFLWERYLENLENTQDTNRSSWTPPPLLRPSVWLRDRGRVGAIMAIAFLQFAGFLSGLLWVQLYYQNYKQFTPTETAVRLVPLIVAGILCNVIIAVTSAIIPMIYLIAIGTLLTACASLLFAVIKPDVTYWAFGFPYAVITVTGADFIFAIGTMYIAKIASPHEQSVIGAVFFAMTLLGSSFGITISTVVFNRVLLREASKAGIVPNSAGTNVPLAGQLVSYKSAFWSTFAFSAFATIIALLFFRGVGIVGEKKQILKRSSIASGIELGRMHLHRLSRSSNVPLPKIDDVEPDDFVEKGDKKGYEFADVTVEEIHIE